ncbi:hypothetical protein [Photorhabdus australis]
MLVEVDRAKIEVTNPVQSTKTEVLLKDKNEKPTSPVGFSFLLIY